MPLPTIYSTKPKQKYSYNDGVCGSGKSYQAAIYLKELAKQQIQVIICPTKMLCEQWCVNLEALGATPRLILSDDDTNVGHQLNDLLVGYLGSDGCLLQYPIIICTQHILKLNFTKLVGEQYLDVTASVRKMCHFWIDELPNVVEVHAVKGHILNEALKARLTIDDTHTFDIASWDDNNHPFDDKLYNIIPIDKCALSHELNHHSCNFDTATRDLLFASLSDKERVYISGNVWHTMGRLDHNGAPTKGDVTFISLLAENYFDDIAHVTVLSADFNYSYFKQLFIKKYHLNFKKMELPLINNGKHATTLLPRTKIHFINSDRFNSKKDLKLHGEVYDEIFLKHLKTNEYLLCTNLDRKNKNRELVRNGRVITTKECGNNAYSDYNNIILDAAQNYPPHIAHMMCALGFTTYMQRQMLTYNDMYQTVLRTSLRDKCSDKTVNIYCVDRDNAITLAERLSGVVGKQSVTLYKLSDNKITPEVVDIHPNPRDGLTQCTSKNGKIAWIDTIDLFSVLQNEVEEISEKRDGVMISPAVFMDYNGKKEIDNFSHANYIFLDFDGGANGISFDDVQRCLTTYHIPHIAHNSFSCSPQMPNKFRVIIPTYRPIICYETYRVVVEAIKNYLQQCVGYVEIGLDDMSKSAVQKYYPAKINSKYPDMHFLVEVNPTSVFDYVDFLREFKVKDEEIKPKYTRKNKKLEMSVEDIISSFLSRKKKSSTHAAIFGVASKLAKNGMSLFEVEQLLNEHIKPLCNGKYKHHLKCAFDTLHKEGCQ